MRPVCHLSGHFLVSLGLCGVGPEGEFGAENGLALQPGALADKHVVEVAVQRLLGDIKHLTAEVQTG